MRNLLEKIFCNYKYKLFLDCIVVFLINLGAILWIYDFIRTTEIFSYAMLMLIILSIIFLFISYYFGVRITKFLPEKNKANKKFKYISGVSFIILIALFIQIIIEGTYGLSYKSSYSYLFYKFSQTFFSDKHDIALEAIDEVISYSKENDPKPFVERADLYTEIYKDMIEESESEVIHNDRNVYNFTSDECLNNAISYYTVALMNEPDNMEYLYKRGVTYRLLGNESIEKATSDLKQAYEGDPDNPDNLLEYGEALIECNDKDSQDKGIELIKKAAGILSGDTDGEEYYKYILKALYHV